MNEYSPQADELLELWKCMSYNMRSVIFRARYLQQKADASQRQAELEQQLRRRHIEPLYREIGRQMREIMSEEGVEKSFPEGEPDGETPPIRRFVDFRISEDAIPAVAGRLEELNRRVLTLFIALCTIRI